ncbi:MAG: hypothetical protein K0R29_2463 [Pseudobdellovibrio sp.]|jgi:hypothetical protein|nr:hypothetical protein [Pseudobdellovibrio sp.]
MVKKFLHAVALAVSISGLTACATHQNKMVPLQSEIVGGQCAPALEKLQKLADDSSDDRLLYLMEYASALQICREYKLSTDYFLQADKLAEQQDYTSISRTLGATLLNEQMIQYKGDKFEKLFINAMAAINFIEMNDYENAMVEVRRINEKTRKFAEEEKRSFELNSFASYLSGLIYEQSNNWDDACISYKDAYNIDASFRAVAIDMLTACWRAKRYDEFAQLLKKVNPSNEEIEIAKRPKKNKHEITIIYMQGWGPKKTDRPNYHLRTSGLSHSDYPMLEGSPSTTKRIAVTSTVESAPFFRESQTIYSVEKAAIATLEADYASLAARRFGARVAKEVVADQIRQKDKALGDIAWVIMLAAERADLRNWSFLPETIQTVRLDATNLTTLKIEGRTFDGKPSEDLGTIDLTINPNKKIYLIRSLK